MSAPIPTFSDRPKAAPTPKLRALVKFPGTVDATTGIEVNKANGIWTFELDYAQFGTLSSVPSSATNYVLSYDTLTGVYALVPSSLLGGGGGGGTPSDVNPVMDGTAAAGVSSLYSRGDHVHPTDTSRAPLASPTFTGVPAAPTAAPATNTTQIATTAFVAAAVSASGGVTPSALTRTNDTNVTLTLGGTPGTALLQATSITAGWSGTLAAARGGFGADISAQSGVPLFTTGAATFTNTTGSGNFVRATSPTLVTPVLGTPASGVLTSCTGLPLTTGVTGNLSAAHGGFGADVSAQSGVPLFASGTATFTSTTGTGVFVRASAPTFTSAPSSPNYISAATSTTGTYFFGTGSGTYLNFDGAKFSLTGGDLNTGSGVVTANGYACRAGPGGATGNTYNLNWTGGLDLWIDFANVGTLTISSDYRIKKDVIDLPGMWDTVKALRPIRYTQAEFSPPSQTKSDSGPLFVDDDIERWGFIAHELQETLTPSAATGVKDAYDTVQSPNPFTVLAALTKALQEAMTRIEALEGQLAKAK